MATQSEKDNQKAQDRTREDTQRAKDRQEESERRGKEDNQKIKDRTREDTERAKGKTYKRHPRAYKRHPDAKLAKTHSEHPEYHTTQAAERAGRAAEKAPDDIAGAGGVGDPDSPDIGGSTSSASEEGESIPTPNAMGKVDPFYVFDRPIISEEITDQGIHDTAGNVGPPAPVSSFDAIICINGKPFAAAIQGIIGNEITD